MSQAHEEAASERKKKTKPTSLEQQRWVCVCASRSGDPKEVGLWRKSLVPVISNISL